jgi:hypothetical protein
MNVIPLPELIKIVKLAHMVISVKQSPVLKGHLCLVMYKKISYELNLF